MRPLHRLAGALLSTGRLHCRPQHPMARLRCHCRCHCCQCCPPRRRCPHPYWLGGLEWGPSAQSIFQHTLCGARPTELAPVRGRGGMGAVMEEGVVWWWGARQGAACRGSGGTALWLRRVSGLLAVAEPISERPFEGEVGVWGGSPGSVHRTGPGFGLAGGARWSLTGSLCRPGRRPKLVAAVS